MAGVTHQVEAGSGLVYNVMDMGDYNSEYGQPNDSDSVPYMPTEQPRDAMSFLETEPGFPSSDHTSGRRDSRIQAATGW